tara:strand:- start:650 stop:814 length:165 start_codon:yes stop_codon:yes gene_type:complete
MNNLLVTKERIIKSERFNAAQHIATKNENLISYRLSVFVERQRQSREEVAAINS